MTTTAVPATDFDYSGLTALTASQLQTDAREIRALVKNSLVDLLRAGQRLGLAKQSLGRGRFDAWLASEVGMSRRWADQLIAAAARFDPANVETVAKLAVLPASAAILLGAPSVSDETVEQVLSGDGVPTMAAVRAAIRSPKMPEPTMREQRQNAVCALVDGLVGLEALGSWNADSRQQWLEWAISRYDEAAQDRVYHVIARWSQAMARVSE
jgi:hypothetical protein